MLLRGGSAIYIDTIHHKYGTLVDTMVTDSDKDRAPHSPIPTGGAQKRGASSGHAFTTASVSRGMPPIELGPAAAPAPPAAPAAPAPPAPPAPPAVVQALAPHNEEHWDGEEFTIRCVVDFFMSPSSTRQHFLIEWEPCFANQMMEGETTVEPALDSSTYTEDWSAIFSKVIEGDYALPTLGIREGPSVRANPAQGRYRGSRRCTPGGLDARLFKGMYEKPLPRHLINPEMEVGRQYMWRERGAPTNVGHKVTFGGTVKGIVINFDVEHSRYGVHLNEVAADIEVVNPNPSPKAYRYVVYY